MRLLAGVRTMSGVAVFVSVFLVPQPAQAAATCGGKSATIIGTAGQDILVGTEADDVVWLGDGPDMFYGAQGNDVVCGGKDDDHLEIAGGAPQVWGGEGNDGFVVKYDAQPFVHGGVGINSLWLEARSQGDVVDLGDHEGSVRAWELTFVHGSDLDDVFRGTAANEFFTGGSGDDQLLGRGGFDTLMPGLGNDVVDGGPGFDTVSYGDVLQGVEIDVANHESTGSGQDALQSLEYYMGTSYGDTFLGTDAAEGFDAGTGDDRVYTRGGDDQITISTGRAFAGSGNDHVQVTTYSHGVTNDATVDLGSGSDTAEISFGHPRVLGRAGNDAFNVSQSAEPTIDGGRGHDALELESRTSGDAIDLARHTGTVPAWSLETIIGSDRDDVFKGNRTRQRFQGGGGNDRLFGRAGRDILLGEKGRDVTRGGAGADECIAEREYSC